MLPGTGRAAGKFQTNVRRSCSKPVKITNPTGSTWNLQPQLDTESWVVRPSILEVPPFPAPLCLQPGFRESLATDEMCFGSPLME